MNKEIDIIERVKLAKIDDNEMNELIKAYKPFIIKVLSECNQAYIQTENSDYVTDGMLAFKEAVDKYDNRKGNFLSFASLIIKRRHIDHLRRDNQKSNVHESIEDRNHEVIQVSIEKYSKEKEQKKIKDEIDAFNLLLASYDLSFQDLVDHAPKKAILRVLYIDISEFLYSVNELRKRFLKTKRLPVKEILKVFQVNRKKVERGRVYILSLVVLKDSALNYLKSYMEKR